MNKSRTLIACRKYLVLFMVTTLLPVIPVAAIEKDFPEAKIKAAYLFNFLRFVEWPPDHVTDAHICVVGHKKEYGEAFRSLRNQSLNNQAIIIREMNDVDNPRVLQNCQIIFVTSTASHRQKMLFNTLKDADALTVGESSDFANHGGMINFIDKDSKISFEVNLDAVNRSGLRITSKILRIADRVISGNQHE